MEKAAADMEEINRRLREIRLGQGEMHAPRVTQNVGYNDFEEFRLQIATQKAATHMAETFTMTDIDARFKLVPSLTLDDDFHDHKMINLQSVVLDHFSNQKLVQIGRHVIPMLVHGFTTLGAAAIFVLAFNLKDRNGDRVFQSLPHIAINAYDMLYSDFPDILLSTNCISQCISVRSLDNELEATAYCYIAASLLQLFANSEDNYVRAFTHICSAFFKFYGKPFPLIGLQPTVQAIRTLIFKFNNVPQLKGALYKILYSGGDNSKAVGLRRFLYELQLANTGMHIISIFIKLCLNLKCEPGVLLTASMTGQFRQTFDDLVKLIHIMTSKEEKYKRKMWRFGRLFSEGFMSHLRTKNCAPLTYVYACALKITAPESNRDILNIVHFKNISPPDKVFYGSVAFAVLSMITSRALDKDASQLSDNKWIGKETEEQLQMILDHISKK